MMLSQTTSEKINLFSNKLKDELFNFGIEFVSANIGRATGNRPVWHILFSNKNRYSGIISVMIILKKDSNFFENDSYIEVLNQIMKDIHN